LQPVRPFVPADVRLAELTPRTLLIGVMLGVVFGASSLYLVLKVGLTISASIPVAVIAVTLFRLAHKAGARDSTILENNIVQTAGSAGESIAFGLGMTMPAILILGFDLDIARVMMVAVLGSLPGILLMIPLRRTLIVAQHGELKDPEGTACAEVLKAAATDASRAAAERPAAGSGAGFDAGSRAGTIFIGFCVGLAYKVANIALKGWKDVPGVVFDVPYRGASLAAEVSPELLGVGYIIGPRIASIMCAGGVLAYLVLIPLIKFFGDALAGIVIAIAAGVLTGFDRALRDWAVRNNPLLAGPNADLLSLIPFVALVVLLCWTARERYRSSASDCPPHRRHWAWLFGARFRCCGSVEPPRMPWDGAGASAGMSYVLERLSPTTSAREPYGRRHQLPGALPHGQPSLVAEMASRTGT
jgi:hypothetical protein